MSDAAEIDLGFASVHWTHSAMFGQEFSAAEMQHKLGQIAVGDLLEAVGRLSCMVEGAEATTEGRQLQILRRLGLFDEASITRLEGLFAPREGGRPRSLFFPQQIIELSRQAIRYGDRRERDGFAEGKLAGDFLRCIFGVTDLLGTELDDMTETSVRRFILLQMGLGSRQETMYLFTRYYDLLVRLWPEVHGTAGRFAPADAFREYTGLTLDEFFILGFAVFTRFLNHVDHVHEPSDFALYPTKYFASTRLDPRSWRRFLDLLSKTPNQLRHALAVETEDYGPGLHRCHTFDRTPLVRLDEVYVPTSFASLERAVTEGAFWLLADAAEAKGLPREEFTAPFGKVFERFAQESLERIASKEATPPKTKRDFYYGPKRARTLSSDMIFLYDREGVFFEVATGRPSVATTTRGDERAFQHDLRKLIVKKADQLRRCWRDFMVLGALKVDGVGHSTIHTVWPVLILIEGFPLMPPVYGQVTERLRRDGWPKRSPPLTLIDADELAAVEAMVEDGWSVERILKRWKRQAAQLPMSNWVASSPDFSTGLGHARWHQERFAEISDVVARSLFGKTMAQIAGDQPPSERADVGS